MTDLSELKVVFVAGFGPIVRDPQASQALYVGALGLPLQSRPEDPGYFHGETLDGVRHFALWHARECRAVLLRHGELAARCAGAARLDRVRRRGCSSGECRAETARLHTARRHARRALGTNGDTTTQPRKSARRPHVHAMAALMEKLPGRRSRSRLPTRSGEGAPATSPTPTATFGRSSGIRISRSPPAANT